MAAQRDVTWIIPIGLWIQRLLNDNFWKPIIVQSEIISFMLIENHYKQTYYFNPEKTGNMALPSKITFTDNGNLHSIRVFKMRPILLLRQLSCKTLQSFRTNIWNFFTSQAVKFDNTDNYLFFMLWWFEEKYRKLHLKRRNDTFCVV